jgi:hypothetical protein
MLHHQGQEGVCIFLESHLGSQEFISDPSQGFLKGKGKSHSQIQADLEVLHHKEKCDFH